MRRALASARLPLLLTVALVAGLLVVPGRAELLLRIYLLLVAAAVLGALVAALRRSLPAGGPSPFDAALARPAARDERVPALEKLEREVTLGASTAFDLHYRLRPPLRRMAGELLAARRGIDLDAQPAEARRLLGPEAWELVRADREPPDDRYAPGVPLRDLGAAVAALERL